MNVSWLEPWMPIDSEDARRAFEGELHRELGAAPLLFGSPAVALAKRQDQDDVLFELQDGRVAEVHLTWRGRPESDPQWPRTAIYPSLDAWTEHQMKPLNVEFRSVG